MSTSTEDLGGRRVQTRGARRQRGVERRALVLREFGHQDGVVSLGQLRDLGLSYDEVRAETAAGRWHRVGRRTISIRGAEPSGVGAVQRWAVWEVGGGACLDGASALLAAGLRGWAEADVHVSVPSHARYRRPDGVRVHVLRDRGTVLGTDPPRAPTEVAALRAARWARTDREAATLLAMTVQQRLVDPARLLARWRAAPRRGGRTAALDRLVPLVADGAQALSEIDFAELGRARGWPEPDRQEVVRTPRGRIYLDVRFRRYRTVAEVNGIQHYQKLASVDDALRRNAHAIQDQTALEIPAVALVLDPEPLLDQVEQALRRADGPGQGGRSREPRDRRPSSRLGRRRPQLRDARPPAPWLSAPAARPPRPAPCRPGSPGPARPRRPRSGRTSR